MNDLLIYDLNAVLQTPGATAHPDLITQARDEIKRLRAAVQPRGAVLDRLAGIAKCVKHLGPVKGQVILEEEGVRVVLTASPYDFRKAGATLLAEKIFAWPDIVDGRIDLASVWAQAMRQAMIAEIEGPDSTNPNRERFPG